MKISQLAPFLALVGSIISGFVWLDSRHEPAGVSDQNRLRGEVYALDLTIADLTSTIQRYNGQEEAGILTDGNRARRAELIALRDYYSDERRARQGQLNAL